MCKIDNKFPRPRKAGRRKRARYVAIRPDQWRALFATIRLIPGVAALRADAGQRLAARLESVLKPLLMARKACPERSRRSGELVPRTTSATRTPNRTARYCVVESEFDRAIATWTVEANSTIRRIGRGD